MSQRRQRAQGSSAKALGDDALVRAVLPVGRSGLAIAAGYLGLCAVLVIPAPMALLVSIAAVVELARDRRKRGWGRAIFGLVMGALFSLLFLRWIMK